MRIEVTLHINVPDIWAKDYDLKDSKGVISMLNETGVTEEITASNDVIVNARVLP